MRPKWTDDHNSALIQQFQEQKIPPSKITIEGKSLSAIKTQLGRLRSGKIVNHTFHNRKYPKNNNYTFTEIRFIADHTIAAGKDRLSAEKLAKLLTRHTVASISRVMSNSGFGDYRRSRNAKDYIKLTAEQKAQVLDFIKGEGQYWSLAMLASKFKSFGVSIHTIKRLRKRHKLAFSHSVSLEKSPEYRKWHKTLIQRAAKSRVRQGLTKYQQIRQRLEEQRSSSKKPAEMQCVACGSFWPKTAAYFRKQKYKLKNGTETFFLTKKCLACPRRAEAKFKQ